MKKLMNILLVTSLLSASSSCYKTIIKVNSSGGSSGSFEKLEILASNVSQAQRYGNVGLGIYEFSTPQEISCEKEVSEIRIQQDIIDVITVFFIGPAYSTVNVGVACSE